MKITDARSLNEIALCYFPRISKKSATNQIRNWINKSDILKEELAESGWRKGAKLLTPKQIRILIIHFGEP